MRGLCMVLGFLAGVLAAASLPAPSASAASGEAPVVVTVTGEIGTTNRGPFDPFEDVLFGVLEEKFETAFTFTLDQLRALPQHEVVVKYPTWPTAATVSGPRLDAVLDAAGAKGKGVLVQAVDGYAPSFAMREVRAGSFILGIEHDGKPLSIGGRGPAWLVFPPGSYEGQSGEDDSGLAWAVFHLKVTPEE